MVRGNVSEALSLLICEHCGGRHIAPHGAWQKAGTPLICGFESPTPTLCQVPGLGGLLILLNEDCVGLYPCGRMPPGTNPERCLDGKWSSSRLSPTLASSQMGLLEPGPGPDVAGRIRCNYYYCS